jgi:hypothetical protein
MGEIEARYCIEYIYDKENTKNVDKSILSKIMFVDPYNFILLK